MALAAPQVLLPLDGMDLGPGDAAQAELSLTQLPAGALRLLQADGAPLGAGETVNDSQWRIVMDVGQMSTGDVDSFSFSLRTPTQATENRVRLKLRAADKGRPPSPRPKSPTLKSSPRAEFHSMGAAAGMALLESAGDTRMTSSGTVMSIARKEAPKVSESPGWLAAFCHS